MPEAQLSPEFMQYMTEEERKRATAAPPRDYIPPPPPAQQAAEQPPVMAPAMAKPKKPVRTMTDEELKAWANQLLEQKKAENAIQMQRGPAVFKGPAMPAPASRATHPPAAMTPNRPASGGTVGKAAHGTFASPKAAYGNVSAAEYPKLSNRTAHTVREGAGEPAIAEDKLTFNVKGDGSAGDFAKMGFNRMVTGREQLTADEMAKINEDYARKYPKLTGMGKSIAGKINDAKERMRDVPANTVAARGKLAGNPNPVIGTYMPFVYTGIDAANLLASNSPVGLAARKMDEATRDRESIASLGRKTRDITDADTMYRREGIYAPAYTDFDADKDGK